MKHLIKAIIYSAFNFLVMYGYVFYVGFSENNKSVRMGMLLCAKMTLVIACSVVFTGIIMMAIKEIVLYQQSRTKLRNRS